MNNYEYLVDFVATRLKSAESRVLDYGCGAGQTVTMFRARGIDAYGCDLFYEGGDYSKDVPREFVGSVIRRMEGDHIPFEDATFDWVTTNFVLEHVPNLQAVIVEIRRVLKPDGFVFSMFPDRGVWREGHCGIPFLHRFPRKSRLRVWYAALFRKLGFGYHTEGKTALEWSENFCRWLDDWTYYRSYGVIRATFGDRFARFAHFEDDWLTKRLGRHAPIVAKLPIGVRRLFVRKMMGMVVVATGTPDAPTNLENVS